MLETRRLDEISLNAIAREANISKANVYRYFESREELFLHLTLEAFDRWRGVLVTRLQRVAGASDAPAVATAFTSTTMEHETFARLISVLSTVLERNVSTETVASFKKKFVAGVGELIAAVQGALPELATTAARELLQTIYFQIVGLWPAAHPAPAVAAALKRPELAHASIDFESALHSTILTVIAGLRASA